MVTLTWHCLLIGSYFEPWYSETKKNIKQAVIEAKRVADQLQVMAGQLDRLANQIW